MKTNWKKNIAVFMSSQAISLFGSSLVQYAIMWHITLTTQSGVATTMAIVCGFLPTLLLTPFAGVWADRYNRKRLVMLADGGIALCTLVLALVYMSGYQPMWMLFVVMAIRALGSAVQMPAVSALLPDIVPTEQLTRINGINGSVQSLITLVSPMLAGALMGFLSLEYIFFIDVVTAAAAILVLLTLLKLPVQQKTAPQEGGADYFKELKQGFSYIRQNKYLKSFFVFCAFFYVLVAPVSFLTPLQVTRFFGDDVWRLTAVEITFSVGMTVGGLVMAAWGGLKNRVYTITLSCVIMGVCTLGLGLPGNFWVYLAFMLAFGLAMPVLNTPAMVLLQEKVDPSYMGRVFGVMTMLNSSIMPLAMLVYGPLSDAIAIEWLLLPTGLLMLGGAFAITRNKLLVKAGLPPSDGKKTSEAGHKARE